MNIGWGVSAGTAAVTDTTLFGERLVDLTTAAGTDHTAGTSTQQTTTVTNDTYQVIGTRTATGAGTVTNAGLFDAASRAATCSSRVTSPASGSHRRLDPVHHQGDLRVVAGETQNYHETRNPYFSAGNFSAVTITTGQSIVPVLRVPANEPDVPRETGQRPGNGGGRIAGIIVSAATPGNWTFEVHHQTGTPTDAGGTITAPLPLSLARLPRPPRSA